MGRSTKKLQSRPGGTGHRKRQPSSLCTGQASPQATEERKRGESETGPRGAAAATMEALKLQWQKQEEEKRGRGFQESLTGEGLISQQL